MPGELYKYRAFSMRAVADMASNRIFLSSPQRFNDAFDGKIPWNQFLTEDELREIVENGGPFAKRLHALRKARPGMFCGDWQLNDDGYLFVRSLLAESFSQISECGICSLSAVSDDLRMWAHYADSRRGFCLGFSTDFPPFSDATEVTYECDLQEIDAFRVLAGKLDEREAMNYLVTKSDIWSEEQEFRIIRKTADVHVRYSPEAVRCAIFGDRTPIEHMVICHGVLPAHVEFFVVNPTGRYAFERIPLDRGVLERYR